jgi:hypothetical protein
MPHETRVSRARGILSVEVFMMKKGIFRFAAAVAAVLTAAAVVWAAPLSKKRATAVLMYDIDSSNRYSSATVWDYYGGVSVSRGGAYAQGAALATETIRGQLLRNGYKVVSDQITARLIKAQSKPAGAGAVKQLSRTFGVGQYIDGSVQVLDTTYNDLGTYTGAAAVIVHGYDSTGRTIFSDSVTAKAAGATADEAEINAVREAALQVAEKLTGVSSNPDAADGGMYVYLYGVRNIQDIRSVLNACKSVYGVDHGAITRYEDDTALLTLTGQFNVSELTRAITDKAPYARITEQNDHTVYVYIR